MINLTYNIPRSSSRITFEEGLFTSRGTLGMPVFVKTYPGIGQIYGNIDEDGNIKVTERSTIKTIRPHVNIEDVFSFEEFENDAKLYEQRGLTLLGVWSSSLGIRVSREGTLRESERTNLVNYLAHLDRSPKHFISVNLSSDPLGIHDRVFLSTNKQGTNWVKL